MSSMSKIGVTTKSCRLEMSHDSLTKGSKMTRAVFKCALPGAGAVVVGRAETPAVCCDPPGSACEPPAGPCAAAGT